MTAPRLDTVRYAAYDTPPGFLILEISLDTLKDLRTCVQVLIHKYLLGNGRGIQAKTNTKTQKVSGKDYHSWTVPGSSRPPPEAGYTTGYRWRLEPQVFATATSLRRHPGPGAAANSTDSSMVPWDIVGRWPYIQLVP